MLQYVMIGLALGSIYAIASSSVVVTFVSTGTLNFAFGAMAYVSARCFYWLNSQHHVSTALAGVISVLVVAPALGVVLWALVFRRLGQQSTVVRVVATVGLSIALVPLADVTFGTVAIAQAPGLAGSPVPYYRVLGTVITLDQIIVYIALLLVVSSGVLILKRTSVGLRVRAIRPSTGAVRPSRLSQVPVSGPVRAFGPVILTIAVVLLPVLVNGYWLGLVTGGFALGIAFLSFTLVTGEGGMIWLCQITFAGAGAIGSAQLVTAQ